jgi:hypothetical protein
MQTVWNVLTIRCTRKLLKRLGAEAIIDPPSPNQSPRELVCQAGFRQARAAYHLH